MFKTFGELTKFLLSSAWEVSHNERDVFARRVANSVLLVIIFIVAAKSALLISLWPFGANPVIPGGGVPWLLFFFCVVSYNYDKN